MSPNEIEWRCYDGTLLIRWPCGCLENVGPVDDYEQIPMVVRACATKHGLGEHCGGEV